jgi:perosamine synthetase
VRIPLSAPDIGEAEIQAVVNVLRSSRLSLGPKMEEFERCVAEYVGASHAIALSSGTSGLHCSLRALGIAEGDEVILPSFTFIAAANVVRYERAVPVFVDIDPVTMNMDPEKIAAAVTPRTRAILVVHTFGCPVDMDAVLAIARAHNLLVIEDACEAIGAEYRGRKVGTIGDVGVFAFYPNKQITTGEGGVVVTNNAETARMVKALRNQGRFDSDDWFQHSILGFSYRISEMDCALGVEQMHRIDDILERRASVARTYHGLLKDNADLVLPPMDPEYGRISWFVYVVRLAENFTMANRDWIVKMLALRGIGSGRYFAPVHQQPAYQDYRVSLPVTEALAQRTIALPFFNRLTRDEIEQVCAALCDATANLRPH